MFSVNKTSALQQEDIVSGLRVLFLKDGLFFEGTVNELMPPDVYVMCALSVSIFLINMKLSLGGRLENAGCNWLMAVL